MQYTEWRCSIAYPSVHQTTRYWLRRASRCQGNQRTRTQDRTSWPSQSRGEDGEGRSCWRVPTKTLCGRRSCSRPASSSRTRRLTRLMSWRPSPPTMSDRQFNITVLRMFTRHQQNWSASRGFAQTALWGWPPTFTSRSGPRAPNLCPFQCMTLWSTNAFIITRPHRLHAVHRCGVLLHMLHVAWSVCLSVGHTGELCKNGSSYWDATWTADTCGCKEPRTRWGSRCPWKETLLRVHVPANGDAPTAGECACQHTWRMTAFATLRGDKMVMRPLATLLWTLIIIINNYY